MSKSYDIHHILEDVVTLPSLPAMVARVTKMVDDPETSLAQIGEAISQDPSLALKTLRLVNSAFYGVREKVSSVEQAVPLLGVKVIKNLVYSAAVFDTLQAGEEDLLRHSLTCGVAMRYLIESGASPAAKNIDPEEGFIRGLLHDIGKIIIHQHLSEDFTQIAKKSSAERKPWVEIEQEIMGIDHTDIGAGLARHWKLSDDLADAIAGHHDLSKCADAGNHVPAALLAIADYICYSCGINGANGVPPALDPRVWEVTGITSDSIVPALEAFFTHLQDVDDLVGAAA